MERVNSFASSIKFIFSLFPISFFDSPARRVVRDPVGLNVLTQVSQQLGIPAQQTLGSHSVGPNS